MELLLDAKSNERLVLIVGTGGSRATTSHMATSLFVGSQRMHAGIRTLCCVDGSPAVTAFGHDPGFECSFAAQVQLLGRKGNLLISISASDNSPSLIEAAQEALGIGMTVVAVTGFDGGQLKERGDLSMHASNDFGDYRPVEGAHLAINHMVTESLQNHLMDANS